MGGDMNKRDVMELRKRLKGDKCNINRMAGCYVDAGRNKVVTLNESFLNLDTEEYEKFLEIARKTMGGTIGNNILEVAFPPEEEQPGGKAMFLNGLRASDLQNEELLDTLYDLIIKNYRYDGNYLILVFHDVYDIMRRTSDRQKLDESEEVYEYILVSICPVVLSKPGLGYISGENRIGARIRDWVVGAPEIGFLYPAFDDGGADIHKVDFFVKDAKDSHPEFVEEVLSCGPKRTSTEKRNTFSVIVKHAFRDDEDRGEQVLMELEDSMNSRLLELEEDEVKAEPQEVDERLIDEVLEENDVEEEFAGIIKENIKKEFSGEEVRLDELIDSRALKNYETQKRERELVKEVESLKAEISGRKEAVPDEGFNDEGENGLSLVMNMSNELVEGLEKKVIDEKEYFMIPLIEGLSIRINGKDYEP